MGVTSFVATGNMMFKREHLTEIIGAISKNGIFQL